ncbi:MAG: fibrobacter succinogenes major paralogous domain-containing protein, partial [Alistipes sp.]|nr:fibrobacter succinogenes major paralogous domain-containing protein [Alistipes sp.]
AENAASFEGCQGICPDGWHIPTNAELTGLVGHNSNGTLTDPTAPYYDATIQGAPIPTLNAAGFNWCFAGARNQANATAKGSYLVTNYGDTYGAMSYVWGSTLHQVQTDNTSGALKNIQFYSFMSTLNASNNKVTVAYGNFKSGYSVRCIKNVDAR